MGEAMSVMTTQAELVHPELRPTRIHGSPFDQTVLIEPARWLSSALAQLWDLEHTGQEIPGFGDFRLNTPTTMKVRQFLAQVSDLASLPVPSTTVISGGGVSLAWKVGEREAKYTFWPEGVLTFVQEETGEIKNEDELAADVPISRKPLEWL